MKCPKCEHEEIIITGRAEGDTFICTTCGTFWDEEVNVQGTVSPEYVFLLKKVIDECRAIDEMEVEVVSNLETTKCIACDGVALKTDDDDYVCNKCGQSWSVK